MVNDPIGDMLTRIRNANLALHESVAMPVSGMKREIELLDMTPSTTSFNDATPPL